MSVKDRASELAHEIIVVAFRISLSNIAARVADIDDVANVLSGGYETLRQPKKLARQLEESANKLAQALTDLEIVEFRGLDENEKNAATYIVCESIDKLSAANQFTGATDTTADAIFSQLLPLAERTWRACLLSEAGTEYARFLLAQSTRYLVSLLRSLPNFTYDIPRLHVHIDQKIDSVVIPHDRSSSPTGHAFISYVRDDSHDVDQLQQALRMAGVPVWRDTADLWPGEDWRAKIKQAITVDALAFIACFSHKSLARKMSYQNQELTLAVEQLRLRRPDQPWLIPVRFDDCDIPDLDLGGGRTLASIQRADLFGERFDDSVARFVAAVQRILGQQTGTATAAVEENPTRVADSATHRLEKVDDASKVDALIAIGESENTEFKSSLHHPYGTVPQNLQKLSSDQARKQVQKALWKSITKTIAAFLNTVGGTLLIGVSDSGAVLGIEPDFAYLKQGKNNADGWLLSLKDIIVNALGPEVWGAISVSLIPYSQQTVAVIHCTRRTTETWHREEGREHFYIRASNATQELIGSSVLRYIRERWPA